MPLDPLLTALHVYSGQQYRVSKFSVRLFFKPTENYE